MWRVGVAQSVWLVQGRDERITDLESQHLFQQQETIAKDEQLDTLQMQCSKNQKEFIVRDESVMDLKRQLLNAQKWRTSQDDQIKEIEDQCSDQRREIATRDDQLHEMEQRLVKTQKQAKTHGVCRHAHAVARCVAPTAVILVFMVLNGDSVVCLWLSMELIKGTQDLKMSPHADSQILSCCLWLCLAVIFSFVTISLCTNLALAKQPTNLTRPLFQTTGA